MRRLGLAGLTMVILAGLVAVTIVILRPAPAAAGRSIALGSATVVRTDIVSHQRVAGILGYGPARGLIAPGGGFGQSLEGTVTWLPEVGSVIGQGQVLYRVGGRPVILLYGTEPAWRELTWGVTGADVRQLEQNLLQLGFANSGNLIADGTFTGADAAAVMRFQSAIGDPLTGVVLTGDVVFEPASVRVTAFTANLGAPLEPGSAVLQATGTQHLVSLGIDAAREGTVHPGDAVSVLLPDGSTSIGGRVASVSSVATAPADNGGPQGPAPSATVGVLVNLDDAAAGGSFDQAPVYVAIATATHKMVLAVPVTALLAQPDGSYAVDVISDSPHRTVTVRPGLYGDGGLVEVAGGISAGESVAVPAP